MRLHQILIQDQLILRIFRIKNRDLIVAQSAANLRTLFKPYHWFENDDVVPRTVDYLTSIGIVALAGNRDEICEDYKLVREMESRFIVKPRSKY